MDVNARESRSRACTAENSEGRGHRRDRLFAAPVIDPVATTDFHTGRSTRAWRLACHRHESDHSCVELGAVCRCRLHMVYRRAARSAPAALSPAFFSPVFLGGLFFFFAV